jgi:translation initiation factor 3 subunit B
LETLKEKLPLIDFSEEIKENPEFEQYLKKECEEYEMTFVHPMEQETAPKLDSDFKNYFLMCGLPIVDNTKKEKLCKALLNVFKKKGIEFIEDDNLQILLDESTGQSYGTAFVKCKDSKEAKLASAAIHNFALGKANTIMSATFDEFDRVIKVPDEYNPPQFADLNDLFSYAMDSENDQFLIREDNKLKVKMNRIPTRVDKDVNSANFHTELVGPNAETQISTKKNATWSPQGRYLIVVKDNIVQLYGGSHFELIREILHTGVSYANISPCEKYIITFSDSADKNEGNYIFWRVDTGELLRAFPFDEYTPRFSKPDVFSFSYDGNYCAKLIKDHVAVYELPEMHLLEDRMIQKRVSIKIENIKDFKWNPSKNMFCYWYFNSENDKVPPKIGFIDIPTREVWSEKEIINGIDLTMDWSLDGTKLISKTKLQRKKEFINNVAIFDVTSRGIPMAMIPVYSNIMSVEWTSATDRLAILHNKEKKITEKWAPHSMVSLVTLFDVKEENSMLKAVKIGTTKDHICNEVIWAQNGNIFICSDTKNSNPVYQGKFYVYYVRTVITKEEVKTEGRKGKGKKKQPAKVKEKREYVIDSVDEIDEPKSDQLVWDPTSRFFTICKLPSSGVIRAAMVKNSYQFSIFNAKGDLLYSYENPKLQQFAWRPRPARIWDKKTEQEFKKLYKKTLRKEIIDNEERERVELLKVTREKARSNFFDVFAPLQQRFKDTKDERKKIGHDTDSEDEEVFERRVMIDYY